MVLTILRATFVLLAAYVGWLLYGALTGAQAQRPGIFEESAGLLLACLGLSLILGLAIVTVDARTARKSLTAISGLFLGLVVGLAFAYALGLVVDLLAGAWFPEEGMGAAGREAILSTIKLAIGVVCCYLAISLIIQTKDDIRFVIPYVEFAKQTKGTRPMLLDTSVIIDGRIADMAESRLIESPMIVPRFVLQELQAIADSSDKLKRNRGRRGLDILNRLQSNDKIDVSITETVMVESEVMDVDHQLVALGKKIGAKVATNDYNLNKIAQLQGVEVINVNDLASALRPVVLPGEQVTVKIIKPGEEVGQGIGYLEDGTMVVGEQCRDMVGQEVPLSVTSVLQTSAGRMIFGRRDDGRGRKS